MRYEDKTLKEFVKDCIKLYFKPLKCCLNIDFFEDNKKEYECLCPINIFSKNILDMLKKEQFLINQNLRVSPLAISSETISTTMIEIISQSKLNEIRKRNAAII